MIYEYECENCKVFDWSQSIHDEHLTSCPKCGSNKIERLISGGLGVQGPIKTLGSLMDKNTSKNKAEISELEHGKKKVDANLAKMTPAESIRYIETGKRPIGLDKRSW